jgi:hypothetical protein
MHSLPEPYPAKYPAPRRPRRALTAGLPPGQMTRAQVRALAERAERQAEALRRAQLPQRVLDTLRNDRLNPGRYGPGLPALSDFEWTRSLFTEAELLAAARRIRNRTRLAFREEAGRGSEPGGRGSSGAVSRRPGMSPSRPRPSGATQPTNEEVLAARRRGVSERDLAAALRLGLPLHALRASGAPTAWLGGGPTDPVRRAGPNGCRLPGHGPNCLCDGKRRSR